MVLGGLLEDGKIHAAIGPMSKKTRMEREVMGFAMFQDEECSIREQGTVFKQTRG